MEDDVVFAIFVVFVGVVEVDGVAETPKLGGVPAIAFCCCGVLVEAVTILELDRGADPDITVGMLAVVWELGTIIGLVCDDGEVPLGVALGDTAVAFEVLETYDEGLRGERLEAHARPADLADIRGAEPGLGACVEFVLTALVPIPLAKFPLLLLKGELEIGPCADSMDDEEVLKLVVFDVPEATETMQSSVPPPSTTC